MSEEKNITYDAFGNIIGLDIPEYNIITEKDSIDVARAKQKVQRELYDKSDCVK